MRRLLLPLFLLSGCNCATTTTNPLSAIKTEYQRVETAADFVVEGPVDPTEIWVCTFKEGIAGPFVCLTFEDFSLAVHMLGGADGSQSL